MASTPSSSSCEREGPWTQEQELLWQRLQRFEFDVPGTCFTFERRLAQENAWSLDFAARAVQEYKRFVFLCMFEPPATPSFEVDQVWHLHLTFTRNYWEQLCGKVLPRPLHHHPTKGGPQEHAKFWQQYSKTRSAYERHFGPPPLDLWPPPELRFGRDTRYRWVCPDDYFLVPRPAHALRLAVQLAKRLVLVFTSAWKGPSLPRRGAGTFVSLMLGGLVALAAATEGNLEAPTTGPPATAMCEGPECDHNGDELVTEGDYRENDFLPWFSGPTYLTLYLVAMILSFFVAKALKALFVKLQAGHDDEAEEVHRLTKYEMAFLRRGTYKHVLDTCVLSLLLERRVQSHTMKVLAVSSPGSEDATLEKEVLNACRVAQTPVQLMRNPIVMERLREPQATLLDRGLVQPAPCIRLVKCVGCLPSLLVFFLLGLTRVAGSHGHNMTFLIMLMLLTLVVGLMTASSEDGLTAKGRATVALMQKMHGHGESFRGAERNVMAFVLLGTVPAAIQPAMQPLLVGGGPSGCAGGGCGGDGGDGGDGGGCGGGGCGGGGCGGG